MEVEDDKANDKQDDEPEDALNEGDVDKGGQEYEDTEESNNKAVKPDKVIERGTGGGGSGVEVVGKWAGGTLGK